MPFTNTIDIDNLSLANKQQIIKKKVYFRSERFMRWWVGAVAGLIQHWYSIEENITSNGQTKGKEAT